MWPQYIFVLCSGQNITVRHDDSEKVAKLWSATARPKAELSLMLRRYNQQKRYRANARREAASFRLYDGLLAEDEKRETRSVELSHVRWFIYIENLVRSSSVVTDLAQKKHLQMNVLVRSSSVVTDLAAAA